MNSQIERPVYELALEATIEALKTIKGNGGDAQTIQAVLKAKMFDEAFLEKQHRQTFLKRVNEALGTGFSMNQVRKADPTLLAAATSPATAALEGTLIPVDELHGESVINIQTPAPESVVHSETHQLVGEPGSEEWILNHGQQQNATLEPAPVSGVAVQEQVAPAATAEQTSNTSNTSLEQPTMKTTLIALTAVNTPAVETAAPAASTATNESTVMNNEAKPKTALEIFVADLVVIGYATEAQRDELYNVFLSENLAFQPQASATAKAAPEGLSNDAQFHTFVSQVPEANAKFQEFAKTFKPAIQSAEARSRFSLRGERDDGVRAGWVAAGSALLGAALETGHRGSLSVGSGIGAVAGIVGSFFAGEMLEGVIDNQFGKYTAAGTLGLAAGALGSGLGRLAQGAISSNLSEGTDSAPIGLPAPAGGSAQVALPASIAALMG